MSFFSKLAKKFSTKSSKMGSTSQEEHKVNNHGSISKKFNDKQLIITKTNVASIYNKSEDYKPLASSPSKTMENTPTKQRLVAKFNGLIYEDQIVDLDALKKLAWQGVPMELRPIVWKILLKYVPLNKDKREATIARKREEYSNFVQMYYSNLKPNDLDENDKKVLKQIKDDVHRTQPEYPLFRDSRIQGLLNKLLWVWHVRHPASGYVQGMNDLTGPFIVTFLREYIELDYDLFGVPKDFKTYVTDEMLSNVEADCYWCLCKILDGILDNYTLSQMGTQKPLLKIKEVTMRIDYGLYKHFEENGIDFKLFSLRWIFCLLVREFPLKVGLRLFDTYISDEQGFNTLHIYVCAAILLKWSIKLKKYNFAEIMTFLQQMPTKYWGEKDIEMLLAEAYVFMTLYEDSHGHFTTASTNNSIASNGSSNPQVYFK